MTTITTDKLHRNSSIEPDLFARGQTPPRGGNRAVILIARRFGLSFDHAGTIARLAGIGGFHHDA